MLLKQVSGHSFKGILLTHPNEIAYPSCRINFAFHCYSYQATLTMLFILILASNVPVLADGIYNFFKTRTSHHIKQYFQHSIIKIIHKEKKIRVQLCNLWTTY